MYFYISFCYQYSARDYNTRTIETNGQWRRNKGINTQFDGPAYIYLFFNN